MKKLLRLATAFAFVTALILGLSTMTEQSAGAIDPGHDCEGPVCGSLSGWTLVGGCYNRPHDCLGYQYENQFGEKCFVSALE